MFVVSTFWSRKAANLFTPDMFVLLHYKSSLGTFSSLTYEYSCKGYDGVRVLLLAHFATHASMCKAVRSDVHLCKRRRACGRGGGVGGRGYDGGGCDGGGRGGGREGVVGLGASTAITAPLCLHLRLYR